MLILLEVTLAAISFSVAMLLYCRDTISRLQKVKSEAPVLLAEISRFRYLCDELFTSSQYKKSHEAWKASFASTSELIMAYSSDPDLARMLSSPEELTQRETLRKIWDISRSRAARVADYADALAAQGISVAAG
jgi:hypothetical protein